MLLLQVIIAILTLLHIPSNAFFISKKYNSTRNWTIKRHFQTFFPIVVKANNSLIHVLDTRDPEHPIRFESIDFDTCNLSLKLTYPSRYPQHATSLDNGKLVVWMSNYQLTPYKHIGEWRFLVVDPLSCTHNSFSIKDLDTFPVDVIDVVGYENTLDIFMTSLSNDEPRNTYVYRYNEMAKPVSSIVNSVIPDLDSYPFYRPNTIKLQAIKDDGSVKGYLYLQIKPEFNSTIIKRLDENFYSVKSATVEHSRYRGFDFDAYSMDHGNFSICRYNNEEHRYFHCLLFDSKLKLMANVSLNFQSVEYSSARIMHSNAKNMPGGSVMVVFALDINYRIGIPIYIQRIGADGHVSVAIKFGKVFCAIHKIDIFEMEYDTYCITVTCDEAVQTRCIEVESTSIRKPFHLCNPGEFHKLDSIYSSVQYFQTCIFGLK